MQKRAFRHLPAFLYVPPMDLVQVKDSMEMLKVKLSDGTVFSMSIFTQGSPEEYFQHIIAFLYLINQKGLNKQCKDYNKEMKTASAALGALKQKSIGPAESSSKKDQEAQRHELEALKIEKAQTQEMLKASTKG